MLPSAAVAITVVPTVVVMSRRRSARPSLIVSTTEPPSESRTSVAPCKSFCPANLSKSSGVRSVIGPTAENQVWQVLPQRSAGTSLCRSKRMDEGLDLSTGAPPAKADRPVQATARPPRKFRITPPLSPPPPPTALPLHRRQMKLYGQTISNIHLGRGCLQALAPTP